MGKVGGEVPGWKAGDHPPPSGLTKSIRQVSLVIKTKTWHTDNPFLRTLFVEDPMRGILSLGLMAALFTFLAPPLQAQDITGTWTLTYTMMGRQGGQGMERSMDVTLNLEGTTVTGTALMQMRGRPGGGDPPPPQETPISDGSFVDGKLTFSITMGMGERSFTQTFVATTVTAETMEGTITGGMRATDPIPFKGVKKEG